MGRIDSPRAEMAPMPFKPLPELRPQLSGLEPDRKLCWKLLDIELRKQRPANGHVISLRDGGMSRLYSPGLIMAFKPFVSFIHSCPLSLVNANIHKAESCFPPEALLADLASCCCFPFIKSDIWSLRKLSKAEMRKWCHHDIVSTRREENQALACLPILLQPSCYMIRAHPVCCPQPSVFCQI